MTQAVENIPSRKIKIVEELINLIKEKRTILIADVSGIPGAQYQEISKKMRGKAVIKVPKKNLFLRALKLAGKKDALGLKDNLEGAIAILFSDLDSYELAADLLKKKSPAKAKTGQIAQSDIEVPAGPTDLVPGPAISELGGLGIQIMIKGGKIEIKNAKVIAEEGKEISQGAADILSKLNILPFEIGFTPLSAYDSEDKVIYTEIKIDPDEVKRDLFEIYSKAISFAVEIGYYSPETTKLMIQKAGAHQNKMIRTITGGPEVEEVVKTTIPVEEKIKPEEKKVEPAADFAAGFF